MTRDKEPNGGILPPVTDEGGEPALGPGSDAEGSSRNLPRGATPSELDALRASIKVSPRGQQISSPAKAFSPLPPATTSLAHRGEIDRVIDEGRGLLETDPKAAHDIFTKVWRRNLNDPRVLSNFGLTLVLVEGDRQRGIRFCEEALRRGLQTTEALVNLAKALVVTRNKEQAVRALRKAMELAPDDPRVGAEFAALGLRRPPPIPWLPRDFILNRLIGMLTWRLSKKYRLDPLNR
jgi:tetratricopeptide (TPR) repeat protein